MGKKEELGLGATEATAPSARAHHAGDGGAEAGPGWRFSSKRKLAVVQRLLRGESQEAVSRELNVPVHRLVEWRDRVLMAAEGALKECERDARNVRLSNRWAVQSRLAQMRRHWPSRSRSALRARGAHYLRCLADGRCAILRKGRSASCFMFNSPRAWRIGALAACTSSFSQA